MLDAPTPTYTKLFDRTRFVAARSWPVMQGGVKWYTRIATTKTQQEIGGKMVERTEIGASTDHDSSRVMISWEQTHEKAPKRVFASFASSIDVFEYIEQTAEPDRCFFETILGARKLFFDIDVSGEVARELEAFFQCTAAQAAEQIVAGLVSGTIEVAARADHPLTLSPSDFRVYESHGENKRSYHVLLQRTVESAAKAKIWYDQVLESESFSAFSSFPKIKNVVDSSVYSTTQQLRLLGCCKSGTGRTKRLRHTVPTATGEVPLLPKPYVNERHRKLTEFCESFASGRAKVLPEIGSKPKPRIRDNGSTLAGSVADRALDLAARHGEFDLDRAEGTGLYLKRRGPSLCPTCNVEHEKENPYLTLSPSRTGAGFDVFFHCRRAEAHGAKRTSTFIGRVEDEHAEQAEAAPDDEDEHRPGQDFLGTISYPGGEVEKLYKEVPDAFDFDPPTEQEITLPPAPKNIREFLSRVLVKKAGAEADLSIVTDAAKDFFCRMTPAERGFRLGGKASGIPSLLEIVEGGGWTVVRKQIKGSRKQFISGYEYIALDEQTPKAGRPAPQWPPSAPIARSPFPLEPPCMRDVASALDLFRDSKSIVLRGALGVGKSEMLIDLLVRGIPALVVNNRRMLLRDLGNSIVAKGGEVLNYEDQEPGPICPPADFKGSLMFCIDSLPRLLPRLTGWCPKIVIFDECESIFYTLTTQTAKREIEKLPKAGVEDELISSFMMMQRLMESTPYVVLCDAGADQDTLNFARAIRPDTMPVHLDRLPPQRKLELVEVESAFEREVLAAIVSEGREGRAVYGNSNSKKKVNHIAKMARDRGHSVCTITADGMESDTGRPLNFKDAVGGLDDLTFSSPKVGAGCSYKPDSGPTRYKKCYGLFTPGSAPASAAVQSCLRVREVDTIVVCVTGGKRTSPVPDWCRSVPDVLRWMAESARGFKALTGSRIFDPITGKPRPYGLLVAKRVLEDKLSSTKAGYERECIRRFAENNIVLVAARPAVVGERRTMEGVQDTADQIAIRQLTGCDMSDRPGKYTPEEKVWLAAREIATMAGVIEDRLPDEIASRAVKEKWMRKSSIFWTLKNEDIFPKEIPQGLGPSIAEILAYHYIADFSRQRALIAMKACLPKKFNPEDLPGIKIAQEHFGFIPEPKREKAVAKLFESAGITVSSWTIVGSCWKTSAMGGLRIEP